MVGRITCPPNSWGHFPSEQAALKIFDLVANQRRPNRTNLTGKTNGWNHTLNAPTVHYGDRIAATINDHHDPYKKI